MSRLSMSCGSLFTAVLSVLMAGCGGSSGNPEVAPATGTVTYQGKPVAGATVNFIKQGSPRTGVGVTNSEGKFQISTFANNDGAIIGDNVVTVVKKTAQSTIDVNAGPPSAEEQMKRMREFSQKSSEPNQAKTDELPTKYANPDVSGLKAIVSKDSSKNNFTFDLVD